MSNCKFFNNFLFYEESNEGAGAILLDSPDNFTMTNSQFQVKKPKFFLY